MGIFLVIFVLIEVRTMHQKRVETQPVCHAFSNLWVGYDFVIARAIAKLLNTRYGGNS